MAVLSLKVESFFDTVGSLRSDGTVSWIKLDWLLMEVELDNLLCFTGRCDICLTRGVRDCSALGTLPFGPEEKNNNKLKL